MATKNIVIVLMVVIAGLIAGGYYLSLPEEPLTDQTSGEDSKIEKQEVVLPAATGNIDDIVDALLKELSDEETTLAEEESDAALVTADSQEISDFGQSADENEF